MTRWTRRIPFLRSRRALLALLALAAALPTPAAAQGGPRCGERARILEALAQRYGETRRASGLAGEQVLVELFASEATGTWTITATLPSGRMCLIAAGTDFEAPALPAGTPAAAPA